jgi:hypothetical protein
MVAQRDSLFHEVRKHGGTESYWLQGKTKMKKEARTRNDDNDEGG